MDPDFREGTPSEGADIAQELTISYGKCDGREAGSPRDRPGNLTDLRGSQRRAPRRSDM